jgi:SAM-dependent methyltransferase
LAAALLDHHRTGRPRRVNALRADGVTFAIDTEEYFTLTGALATLDAIALERCRGRVLDVGAGAGRHALALQARGHEVVAIDLSPIAVALCRERGVADARVFDVMQLDTNEAHAAETLGRFDTLLFGMQTIGVAGGVGTLGRLLGRLASVLAPGGELIVDSSALREPWEGDDSDTTPRRGEIVLSTRYRGWRGEPFPWLYLSEQDLHSVAREAGFEMETLGRVPSGEFLAALRVAGPRAEEAGSR